MPLVKLLPGITLEVVQIRFVVAISVVLTELQEHFEIIEDLGHTWIGFDGYFASHCCSSY